MLHYGAADESDAGNGDDDPGLPVDGMVREPAEHESSAENTMRWGDGAGGGHTVLRALTEPSPTAIFFIAPLAVGGQRAYYNFARQFLSWTKPNPLYSLDHDTLGEVADWSLWYPW